MFGLVNKHRQDREHAARIEQLVNQRDDARALAAERLDTIKRQAAEITKLRQDAERPALQPAAQPVSGAEARLRGELHRSQKAREALDSQCRELQTVNEAQARQLRELSEAAAEGAA